MVDPKDEKDLKRGVEAILFAAGRVVSIKELKDLLGLTRPERIRRAVDDLREEYDSRGSSMMVVEEGDGWKLTVRESVLPLVHTINPHTELSKSILETLAVIAWKQPIVQSDVIKVRTNKAYDHIAELEKLGFIAKERFGRSYAIKVTQKFMDYFDLPDDKAVKELFKGFKDVELAVQKKADEFEKQIPEEDKEVIESRTEAELDQIAMHQVEDELGMEAFSDELPPVDFPAHEDHLRVYSAGAGSKAETEDKKSEEGAGDEDQDQEETGEESAEQSDGQASTPKATGEESEDQKARRLARELLGEDEKPEAKKKEESVPTRELHPALEEFIAGEKRPKFPLPVKKTPEPSKKPSADVEQKKPKVSLSVKPAVEEPAKPSQAAVSDISDVSVQEDKDSAADGSSGSDEDSSASDKPKPAEEFPGQFDSPNDDASGEADSDDSDEGPAEER
ncbi:TPA: SMC-Scp complex subunit ScpB [Candidatus Woesearchaeota archaeon]|nr:SMC-Scp complex subunit ScpB [Candidatus Woesearchaeota archaeon]